MSWLRSRLLYSDVGFAWGIDSDAIVARRRTGGPHWRFDRHVVYILRLTALVAAAESLAGGEVVAVLVKFRRLEVRGQA